MRYRTVLSHRYLVLFAGGLLCLSGSLFAEPQPPPEVAPGGADNQVWGDPEDGEETDQGWTWFGMGYEQRTGASGQSADGENESGQSHENGQGNGAK